MHDTNTTLVPQRYKNNPLFAKPPEDENQNTDISPLSSFFSDTPTSADFLAENGAYEDKIATIRQRNRGREAEHTSLVPLDREASERKRIIETNSKYPTTPAQQKIENYLIENNAPKEAVENYLRYKNMPREKILRRSKVLSAFFDLLPEDIPVLDDFLVMAHRNNIGYAFSSPSEDGEGGTVYHLTPPCE